MMKQYLWWITDFFIIDWFRSAVYEPEVKASHIWVYKSSLFIHLILNYNIFMIKSYCLLNKCEHSLMFCQNTFSCIIATLLVVALRCFFFWSWLATS